MPHTNSTSFRRHAWLVLPATCLGMLLSLPAGATATLGESQLHDRDGNKVGEITMAETPNGVLLYAKLDGLPSGVHAFHLHETGLCEPPFKSAGGHLTGETPRAHGYIPEAGPHLGDMPNIHVPDSGQLNLEVMTRVSDMDAQIFDDDGAAVVIHQGPDDYQSQPAGAAGPRIACGVIEKLN
ncbi:Superoxide dismutase [Cu-Zn] precursor [Thiorhodovibrio winogradskyi]|uniref:Superoxide dismutase [Cu-Zn] n=1 Tax=Thiorhodovibrio winogradskyi TaxID=77007 RepID=A0ABZ0SD44_9GAMM|nr:superoxide dismutase family protein [Thiorhodovibrio winogradskyi]